MEKRYSILEQKGKNLFKAHNRIDDRTVFLKKVSFSSISPKKKQHIVNEVNTLIRMDNVHVIRYLDYEINKKDITVDIVMEYCHGGSLQQLLTKLKTQNKRISEEQVWRIFYQLVQALDYIHQDGIMHRNINPANIYFQQADRKQIKLGGFSLSKRLDIQEQFSSTVLPNTYYLSSQQIDNGMCTKETDIWALGCLIYEICALQSPYRSSNEFQRAKLIKEAKPKKLSSSYSIQLSRVILWCMDRQPERRPTIQDLLAVPQISIRIRERRYMVKFQQLRSKEERLCKRQKQLMERQEDILREQKLKTNYQSLKKRNSEMQSSRTLNAYEMGTVKNIY